jgi:predicted CXXCH cytochrome family protein
VKKTVIAFLLCAAGAAWAQEKPHPALVDPASAKCETCHASLLEGTVHEAVKMGCDGCHAVRNKEDHTVVAPVASGRDLCLTCHDGLKDLDKKKAPHSPVEDCGNCHLPHASREKHLLKAALPDLCLECHDREEMKTKVHKDQPVGGTDCIGCHGPHGTDFPHMIAGSVQHRPFKDGTCEACHRPTRTKQVRLVSKQPGLCFACHSDLEAKFKGAGVHAPVGEGNCTACHNPHATGRAKLLKDARPQLCFSCHPDIKDLLAAGPHAPAQKDCGACHAVHASSRPHLLAEGKMTGPAVSTLCAGCHDLAKLKPGHRGADMGKLDCASCHNPHGSKGRHLLNTGAVHPPFQEGCDSCHGEGTALNEKEPTLCFMCHDEVEKQVKSAKVAHKALDSGCTACHTPHDSRYAHLFKGPQTEVCGACHEMKFTRYHGIIGAVGCQACHEPHGGGGAKLLKASGNALCLSCHDAESAENPALAKAGIKVRRIQLSKDKKMGHPIGGHPVDGKPQGRKAVTLPGGATAVSCLSCHNPHGGKTAMMFISNKERNDELCLVCHKK